MGLVGRAENHNQLERPSLVSFTPKFYTPPVDARLKSSPYDTAKKKEAPVSYEKEVDLPIQGFLQARSESVVAKRQAVGRQYRMGIDKLKQFIAANAPEKSIDVETDLDTFIGRLESGLEEGTGGFYSTQIGMLLGDGKVAMDSILQALELPDIPLDRKLEEIGELARGLVVCGPGVGANLIMHAQALQFAAAGLVNHARGRWETMFTNAVLSYCTKEHGREPGYDGEEIHYVNQYRSFLGPLFGLKAIDDDFKVPHIGEAEATKCLEKISPLLTPNSLIGGLADDCFKDINRVFGEYKDIQAREGSFGEHQVYEMQKLYEKDLEDSFKSLYGGIPFATVVNEYYNAARDGESYRLIDSKVLLMRDIARNLRSQEALQHEKLEVVSSLPELAPGRNGEGGAGARRIKSVGPDSLYVKEDSSDGAEIRYPFTVREMLELKQAKGLRRVEDGMMFSALDNTFDEMLLSKVEYPDVWRAINIGSFDGLMDHMSSPGLQRYRAAGSYNNAGLVDRAIERVQGMKNATQRGIALVSAITHNDSEIAKHILNRVGSLNVLLQRPSDGMTALHAAAEHGMASIVDDLMEIVVQTDFERCRVGRGQPAADVRRDIVSQWMSMANNSGLTPLLSAAKGGSIGVIDSFLELGAKINQLDRFGRSAVFHAAASGKADAVRFLVANGADFTTPDVYGRSPLHIAAEKGHVEAIDAILSSSRRLNLEIPDDEGKTVLMHASKKASNAVPLLLAAGAATGTRNRLDGRRAIDYAAIAGKADVIRSLAQADATVEIGDAHELPRDFAQLPPLCYAAHFGHAGAAGALIEAGAAVDAQDSHGVTPLAYAASRGNRTVIERLIEVGANVELTDRMGVSPLQRAICADKPDCTGVLLHYGANCNVGDPGSGRTPLMAAATWSSKSLSLLLQGGARLNARDRRGETAAIYAAKTMHPTALEGLKVLMDAGADMSMTGVQGCRTAMEIAVEYANVPAIRLLAKHRNGADVDGSRAPDASSPLGQAIVDGRPEVVKALLDAGANPMLDSRGIPIGKLADRYGSPQIQRMVHDRIRELQDQAHLMERQFRGMGLYEGRWRRWQ
ncbi:ankyrin repeat domain-containing protein [Variovorax sp. 770b2]|uniref:ankyrin repeat domain-containing protein n=1 Tax=Variovorax sp. 770b2 TaxID=1566271 RepID=UPI0008E627AC|nr:ankyrin repeat domain-containing protein [Variovorax sp. 770b2]SFQ04018.1 Ankyrin repeat [Variovorax sp. 770b2]